MNLRCVKKQLLNRMQCGRIYSWLFSFRVKLMLRQPLSGIHNDRTAFILIIAQNFPCHVVASCQDFFFFFKQLGKLIVVRSWTEIESRTTDDEFSLSQFSLLFNLFDFFYPLFSWETLAWGMLFIIRIISLKRLILSLVWTLKTTRKDALY